MIADLSPSDRSKYACALHASKLVKSGMKVGLGTGSTAYWLVYHLAERVRNEDLKFFGVPTSNNTRDQAQAEGIKAVSYTHLRAHETPEHLVCRLLLEKKNK